MIPQVLGKALPLLPRDQIFVATKCGRYKSGHDFSRSRVTASVKESLKRLQISYLDIVHCHDVEFVDLDVVSLQLGTPHTASASSMYLA